MGYYLKYKNGYLHTDGKFYTAFFSMKGCQPKAYKTLKRAERMAQVLQNRGLVNVSVVTVNSK